MHWDVAASETAHTVGVHAARASMLSKSASPRNAGPAVARDEILSVAATLLPCLTASSLVSELRAIDRRVVVPCRR